MAQALSTAGYDNVVVIDTQVVLEAKPLDQLPWADLFPGRTLLLVCRQVQSEIDAKKNDGRLGKRARAFNKLLDEFISTRVPTTISATQTIDVALVANVRIDWDILDDLDREDGDDRIVAQALNANVDDRSRLTVLSHDMRPRDAAFTHGLRAVKLPEDWLREPEPSPDQRRLTELEGRIRLLSMDQPEVAVRIEAVTPEPWIFRAVEAAGPERSKSMLDARLAAAPRASARDPHDLGGMMYDPSHADRLNKWRERLREDIPLVHAGLARLFGQQLVRVTIENTGSVPAEALSLEIRSGNSVLHAKHYWVLIAGESAPQPRYFDNHLRHLSQPARMPKPREQFSFYWDERGPGDHVMLSCASFRQGKSYEVELTLELLITSLPKAHVEAVVTAANMKGDVRKQLIVPVTSVQTPFEQIYDMADGGLKERPPFDLPDDIRTADFRWYRNNGAEPVRD